MPRRKLQPETSQFEEAIKASFQHPGAAAGIAVLAVVMGLVLASLGRPATLLAGFCFLAAILFLIVGAVGAVCRSLLGGDRNAMSVAARPPGRSRQPPSYSPPPRPAPAAPVAPLIPSRPPPIPPRAFPSPPRASPLPPRHAPSHMPYRRRPLFSRGELAFYSVLRDVADPDIAVFGKVHLYDLLVVPKGSANWKFWFRRASQKHVDFVLCDAITLDPFLVIELDDRSHASPRRARSDRFKDEALRAAGISLSRIRNQQAYDVQELAEFVRRHRCSR